MNVIKTEPADYDDDDNPSLVHVNPESSLIVKVEVKVDEEDMTFQSLVEAEANEEEVPFCLHCPKCDLPYLNPASYKNHVAVCKRHVFKRPLSREELEKSKIVREEMKRSIKILERSCFREFDELTMERNPSSSSSHPPEYFCSSCDESFPSLKWFARHAYAHTFVKRDLADLPHICADCGRDFPSRRRMTADARHARRGCKNLPKLVFTCDICRKMFTRKDNLREHLRGHAGMTTTTARQQQKYNCRFCRRTFGGSSILNIHLRSHTKNSGSYSHACGVCKKTFACASSLKKHGQMHEARQFQCGHCSLKFATEKSLQQHLFRAGLKLQQSDDGEVNSRKNDINASSGSSDEDADNYCRGNQKEEDVARKRKRKKTTEQGGQSAIDSQLSSHGSSPPHHVEQSIKSSLGNVKTYTRRRNVKNVVVKIEGIVSADMIIKEEPLY